VTLLFSVGLLHSPWLSLLQFCLHPRCSGDWPTRRTPTFARGLHYFSQADLSGLMSEPLFLPPLREPESIGLIGSSAGGAGFETRRCSVDYADVRFGLSSPSQPICIEMGLASEMKAPRQPKSRSGSHLHPITQRCYKH